MGFFSSDMEALVDIYQCETADLIKEMEAYLMQAEQENLLNAEVINGIFRVVHTIKSSSAMMCLEELSTGTHHLEDLFLMFREDSSLSRGHEKRIFDLLYAYSDYVKDEIERITEEAYEPSPVGVLMEQINREISFFKNDSAQGEQKVSASVKSHQQIPEEEPEIPLAPSGKNQKLRIIFKENCQMENVRAFLLVKQVKDLCERIQWEPENLDARNAAVQIRETGLFLDIFTMQMEEIEKKLNASPYVERVEFEAEQLAQVPVEQTFDEAEQVDEKREIEQEVNVKSSKFSSIPWERIIHLQEITEDLITIHTMLNNTIEEMGNPRELEDFSMTFHRALGDLERVVNAASLTPVRAIKAQLYRIVRDICKTEGKEVGFHINGEDIEVDKNLIDSMLNPMIHLIRNAIDHGIELPQDRERQGKDPVGQVMLDVSSEEGTIVFRIFDDGKGMDPDAILQRAGEKKLLVKAVSEYTREEALNFILMPGFSTTKTANEYSGRGVGMDVVNNIVDSLGGVLEVNSEKGEGSEFIIRVPVSMTSIDSIRFMVGDVNCLVPIRSVDRIYSLREIQDRISVVDDQELFQDDQMIPVLHMGRVFQLEADSCQEEYMLVLHGIKNKICIISGQIKGQQIIVEKKLPEVFGSEYRNNIGISGCAIISDGNLGMMLSAEKLIQLQKKGQNEDARAKYTE